MADKNGDRDFLIFSGSVIAAVVIARLWNVFLGNLSLIVNGTEIHHIYMGIVLIGAAGIVYRHSRSSQPAELHLAAVGFGTGLVTDELAFILFTPDTYSHYFTPLSIHGAALATGFTVTASYLVTVQDRRISGKNLRRLINYIS